MSPQLSPLWPQQTSVPSWEERERAGKGEGWENCCIDLGLHGGGAIAKGVGVAKDAAEEQPRPISSQGPQQ